MTKAKLSDAVVRPALGGSISSLIGFGRTHLDPNASGGVSAPAAPTTEQTFVPPPSGGSDGAANSSFTPPGTQSSYSPPPPNQPQAPAANQQQSTQQQQAAPAPASNAAPAPAATQSNGNPVAEVATQLLSQVREAVQQQVGPLQEQVQQLQSQFQTARQPSQNVSQLFGGGAPGVRQGEDPLSSRGYELTRVLMCLSGQASWEHHAKVELGLHNRLHQVYGGHLQSQSALIPMASEHIHSFDSSLAQECRELTTQSVRGTDPDEMRRYAQQAGSQRVRQALSIYDDTGAGIFLGAVETGEMIDLLRAFELFSNAGARELTLPPNGRLQMHRHTGSTTGYWVGQGAPGSANRKITGSEPTTGGLLMNAKKLAALVQVPNDLIRFSTPSVESFIRTDIADTLAVTLDETLLTGAESSLSPKGLINYPNILTHIASTVGANGDTLEPNDLDEMVAKVEEEQIRSGNFTFGIRPLMWTKIKNRRAAAVSSGDGEGPFVFMDIAMNALTGNRDVLNGWRCVKTTQVPKNRAKGSGTDLTLLIGGVFSEYIIARHGVLEFAKADQHEASFANDEVTIRAIEYVDGGPRREEAFIMCDDLLVA